MSVPALSIIMAMKNAQRYLTQALDSISSQSFQDFEIVVVDGNSSDDSRKIAELYPKVRCIAQHDEGFSNAWNLGIESSRAPLVSFLDSDDIWLPSKLALQVARLESHPAADCVIGRVQFFRDGETLPRGFNPDLLNGSHMAYMPGTSMLRRKVFDRIGHFEAKLGIVTDIAWFAKLRDEGVTIDSIDEVVLRKRVHANNLSYVTQGARYRTELLAMLGQRLRRKPPSAN
jgi:glycosyltransferase involved in cell wall biosynthesis